MLVKLAFANVRKSARDFAVYFFTLVLGVAVFCLMMRILLRVTPEEAARLYRNRENVGKTDS